MLVQNKINSLKTINLPNHIEGQNGQLIVLEGMSIIPFNISRVFTVIAPKNAIRGEHAHIECTQLLTCIKGIIDVICDDGFEVVTIRLDNPSFALLIPPTIWAKQIYLEENSILMVLCDRIYEKNDYIRNYNSFKKFKYKDV